MLPSGRTAHKVIEFALSQLTRDERRHLLCALAQRLDIDPVDLFERRRVMTLLDLDEIRLSASQGVSIQLHTHRHRFPLDDDPALRAERSDNRSVLESYGFTGLVHFCYPSGVVRSPRCAGAASDQHRDGHNRGPCYQFSGHGSAVAYAISRRHEHWRGRVRGGDVRRGRNPCAAFAAGRNRAACGRAWQFVGTLRL